MDPDFDSVNEDSYIPGTLNIYAFEIKDDNELSVKHSRTQDRNLKTSGNIILVPQPSDSPNDPLNWSRLRKLWNLAVLAFITGFTAATSNDAGAIQDSLNQLYGITYDSMNTGAGVLFIGIGWGTIFLAPCANLYGRKITYLICIFLGLLGAVWFALSKDTTDTIWSQLFVGISARCGEVAVQLSLSDMYFQHQLGTVLTIYILATSVGTYLGPLIAGFIVEYVGFRWVGWIAVFISTGLLTVIVFGADETVYDRKSHINPSHMVEEKQAHDALVAQKSPFSEKRISVDYEDSVEVADNVRKSYWQRIKLITPAENLRGTGFRQYIRQLAHLFKVFLYPPVIYSGLVWGFQDALLTFYLTVEDDQYYDPPYNYGDVGVALMNVPCLIGAIIGCVYAGIVSDWFSIWLAKKNGGIQEAEFRLWFLFIPGIIAPIGLILFAVGTDQVWNWVPTYVGLGFIGLGFGASGDVSMSYLMDAYPEMVIEMMCGVAVINNMCGCIFTFACSPWLDAMGNTHTFIILAVIEFVIMMSAGIFIYYGKRIRVWTKPWYIQYCAIRDGL